MRIPHSITKCYEALGLGPRERDLNKGRWEPKAKLCRTFLSDFFDHDSGHWLYEEEDELDQFQERAELWVRFYASRLWAANDRTDLFPDAPTYPRDSNIITRWMLLLLAHKIKSKSKKDEADAAAEQKKADALAHVVDPPKKTKWKNAEDMDPNDPRLISNDNAKIIQCLVTDSETEQGPAKAKEAATAKVASPASPKEAIIAKEATPGKPTAATAAKEKQPTTLAPPTKGLLKRPLPSGEGDNAKASKKNAKAKPTSQAPLMGSSAINPIALPAAPPSTRSTPPKVTAALTSTHQQPPQPLFPGLTAVHLDQTYILAKLSSSPFAEPLSLRACLERPSIYDAVVTKLGLAGRKHEIQRAAAKFADCDVPVRIRERAEDQQMLLRYVRSRVGFCFVAIEVTMAS